MFSPRERCARLIRITERGRGHGPVFGVPCGCDISEKSATAILRFTSTQRITDHGRSGLYDWPHFWGDGSLGRNAPRCRVLSFLMLGAWGICFLYVGPWQLVSANFQISAIPYWKLDWMDCFFIHSPPAEGQSEEHTDWEYCSQSC